jgi:hypothetical protein
VSLENPPPSEATDVKEAIALLWKKLEAAMQASEDMHGRTQEQLNVWIQTNYLLIESNQRLIDAILAQSQETVRSMQCFEHGFDQLETWSEQLQHIEAVMTEWQQGSMPRISPSLSPEHILQSLI